MSHQSFARSLTSYFMISEGLYEATDLRQVAIDDEWDLREYTGRFTVVTTDWDEDPTPHERGFSTLTEAREFAERSHYYPEKRVTVWDQDIPHIPVYELVWTPAHIEDYAYRQREFEDIIYDNQTDPFLRGKLYGLDF